LLSTDGFKLMLELSGVLPCCCYGGFRGFKALKQMVKLLYKLGDRKKMMEAYRCTSPGSDGP
jgi:hypothetical protein